jgi:sec-independent protein translocase protein TatB
MFDMGFLELLLIGVVGLLVLGPERLPKAARTLGLWIGKIKRSVSGMQREINSQLEAEELRQKLNEQQKKLDDSLNTVKHDVESIAEPEKPAAPKSSTSSPSPDKTPAKKPANNDAPAGGPDTASAPHADADKDSTSR